jgi:hypothetical protein
MISIKKPTGSCPCDVLGLDRLVDFALMLVLQNIFRRIFHEHTSDEAMGGPSIDFVIYFLWYWYPHFQFQHTCRNMRGRYWRVCLQQVCLRFSPEQEDKRCCIHLSLTHGTIEVFFASWRKCTRASLSAALPNQRNTQDGRRFLDDSNHGHDSYYFRQKKSIKSRTICFLQSKASTTPLNHA